MAKSKLTLYDCDRCKFTFRKHLLRRQRGMLLCDGCFDSVLEIAPVNLRLNSPRDNSTSTVAVTEPITFNITVAGITALGQSQTTVREGTALSYQMHIAGSGGPVVVTGNPAIVAGTDKFILELKGTSDTNSVSFTNGNGLELSGPIIMKKDGTLTLVYNSGAAVWREASRYP